MCTVIYPDEYAKQGRVIIAYRLWKNSGLNTKLKVRTVNTYSPVVILNWYIKKRDLAFCQTYRGNSLCKSFVMKTKTVLEDVNISKCSK